jgi:hypothetical protein
MKRFLSVLLILSLMVTMLTMYAYADLGAVVLSTAPVAAGAVLGTLLVAAGISSTSPDVVGAMIDKVYDSMSPQMRTAMMVDNPYLGMSMYTRNVITGAYGAVYDVSNDLWAYVRSWVDANYDAGENQITKIVDGTVTVTPEGHYDSDTGVLMASSPTSILISSITFGYIGNRVTHTVSKSGASYKIHTDREDLVTHEHVISDNFLPGTSPLKFWFPLSGGLVVASTASIWLGDTTTTSVTYGGSASVNVGVATGAGGLLDVPDRDFNNENVGRRGIFFPIPKAHDGSMPRTAEGNPDIPWDDALRDTVGAKAQDVVKAGDKTDVRVDVETGAATDEAVGDQAITQTMIDWSPLTQGFSGILQVFPFCIPFDIRDAVVGMQAVPEAPKFQVNFPASLFPGGGTFDIDMSQFESLAVIVRYFVLLSFLAGMFVLTGKVIKW